MKRKKSLRTVRVKRVVGNYPALLAGIKERIRAAQVRATLAANAELIWLYWEVGRMIAEQQEKRGWGKAVIPRLAKDLCFELPEVKGFSSRNLGYMIRFYQEYRGHSILQQPVAKLPAAPRGATPAPILQQAVAKLGVGDITSHSNSATSILPQAVAKLRMADEVSILQQPAAKLETADFTMIVQQLVAQLPWGHHILLMEKVKDLKTRVWYMRETVANGWSRSVLGLQISGRAHERQGRAITNFDRLLPAGESDLAKQMLKDPYIFDFLTLEEPFHERELETQLLGQVQKFLLEMGQGFAFVGRQFPLEVGGDDFYIDLLFYHLRLRCFVVVDLKKGKFEAEHAGKMNFYCNVVDEQLRHPEDKPTVGMILCQEKNGLVAEYALRGMEKAIGVSGYALTRVLPRGLQSSLPSIREIEAEFSSPARKRRGKRRTPAKRKRAGG